MNIENVLMQSLSYEEYRKLVNELVVEGKTTGDTHSDKLLEFTKLNIHRMNRLDKTIRLSERAIRQLQNNTNSYKFLLIGDAWCGDCAQIIPVINKIALSSYDRISLTIISRDAHSDLTEKYQTNGAKAIPKLLIIDEQTWNVILTWGPRPKPAQTIMLNWKENRETIPWEDFEKELHLWYTKDQGETIVDELVNIIEKCEKKITLSQKDCFIGWNCFGPNK